MPKPLLAPEVAAALPPEISVDTIVAQARLSTGLTAQFGETHLLRAATGELVVLTRESSFASFASVALRAEPAPRLDQRGFDIVLRLTTADGAEHALAVDAFAQSDVERVIGAVGAAASKPATTTATAATATTVAPEAMASSAPAPQSAFSPSRIATPRPGFTSTPARAPEPVLASAPASLPVPTIPTRKGGLPFVIGLAFVLLHGLVPNQALGLLVAIVGGGLVIRGAILYAGASKAHASALAAHRRRQQAKAKAAEEAERAAEAADAHDPQGTALRSAIEDGDLEKVRRLLSAGADPRAVDEDGASLLHCAADSGLDDDAIAGVMQLLLSRGADLNTADATGSTALMLAATNGHGSAARLLLDRGANLEARDEDGWTALRYAIEFNDDETLALFFLARGADASSADSEGETVSHAAKRRERPQVLAALLARGIE